MVAPDQLLQADVRIRQAKENPDMRFGGLITILSGDFLQLPPIAKLTLATDLDDAGFVVRSLKEDDVADDDDEQTRSEARQGIELWRSLTTVVSLVTNIRPPRSSQSVSTRDAGRML